MNAWQAIVLGVVEGVTEFLPISSTGHLILAQRALGLPDTVASHAYTVCIQAGAILAVLELYAGRVSQMVRGILGRDAAGRRLALNIVVAFLPAAIVGLALEKKIDEYLFGLWPVIAAWFIGGVAILAASKLRRAPAETAARASIDALDWKGALAIGAWQCLALWPGTSRSLVTIAGGVVVGLSLASAVEFSLVLGLVTLLAATGHKAIHGSRAMLDEYGWMNVALGLAVAFAFAWISVKWMVGYLKSHGLSLFGWYRVALALCVAALVAAGIVSAT
jgi:undecaprenyl-diphosphatase